MKNSVAPVHRVVRCIVSFASRAFILSAIACPPGQFDIRIIYGHTTNVC